MKYIFTRINEYIESAFETAIPQGFSSTKDILQGGVSGIRCRSSFLDRHVLPDTDALRNPLRSVKNWLH